MTQQELLDAVRMAEALLGPGCFSYSQIGNIVAVSADGEYLAFVDLSATDPEDLVTLMDTD